MRETSGTQSFAKVSAQVLRCEDALRRLLAGAALPRTILFPEMEDASGVTMNVRGRDFLRSAMHRLGLVWSSVPGKGVVIADAALAVEETTRKVRLIGNATRRAARTYRDTVAMFGDEIPSERRTEMALAQARLGAIASLARGARAMGAPDADGVLKMVSMEEVKQGALRAMAP